ncbi:MAG: YggS family pyridoxal phosphate-dependent enzyme [Planctomycetota bacterium]
MTIAEGLARSRAAISEACRAAGREESSVALLAVSKTHPAAAVREAHAAGQRLFGENRVQDLLAKARDLADLADIEWHLIGSLQTNKVRMLLGVPGLALVQSLDRARLADALQAGLEREGRSLPVLLQIRVTGEPTKHGCPVDEAFPLLRHVLDRCPRLEPRGVMAMGPLGGDPLPAFRLAAEVRSDLARRARLPLPILSLGMSSDFPAAIACGSTMVRIGTAIFGAR